MFAFSESKREGHTAEEYRHQEESDRLGQINKTLTELHEDMIKKNGN